MYHSRLVSVLLIASFVLNLCAGAAIYPKSLATQKGSASDVSLSALNNKDQSGDQDSWSKYVEFYGSDEAYQGVFTFDASSVDAAAVGAYTLEVNFKGPKINYQSWSFEFFDASTNSWVDAGDNTDAPSWAWTSLSFCGTVDFASLVKNGNIQLRMSSGNNKDNCDVDYLAIHTTEDAQPATDAPATQAPATQAPATQRPPIQATEKPVKPTQAPTQAPRPATAAPTKRPATQAPTKRPAATPKPTPKPTQKPVPATEKPTQKPTPATSAPTSPPASSGGKLCPANQVWAPAPGTTWQWQITGTIDQSFDVQMYDIDLFDATAAVISQLHSKGRAVICYFSTQYENWRPDAAKFTPSSVLGNNLDDWPGERYADIRSSVVREIMKSRMDMAVTKGCDGVEPDNVDGYANPNGLGLTAADQLEYNKFLANEAHKRGLSIGLKNDLDQVKSLVSSFDWALNEQCNEYGECSVLSNFVSAGKAVFGVEYKGSASSFCPSMASSKFSWLLKDLSLGAKINAQCCTYATGGCAAKPAYKCVTYNTARSEMEAEESAIVAEELVAEEALVAEPAAEPEFDSAASSALPVMAVVLAAAVALVM
jgi:hypothetical protein